MAEFTFIAGDERIQIRLAGPERARRESGANVLPSTVTAHIGAFSGSFTAEFRAEDILTLHEHLKNALDSSFGSVALRTVATDELSLTIEIIDPHRAVISGVVRPHRRLQATLNFLAEMATSSLVRTLEEIDDALLEIPQPEFSGNG
jgi:hypothetical protein